MRWTRIDLMKAEPPCESARSDLHPSPDRSEDLDPGEFSTAKRASKSLIRSKVRDLVRAPVHPDGPLSPRPIRLGPVLGQGLGRGHISSAPTIDKFSTVPCSDRGVDSPGSRPTARVPVRKVLDLGTRSSHCARILQIRSTCPSKQLRHAHSHPSIVGKRSDRAETLQPAPHIP